MQTHFHVVKIKMDKKLCETVITGNYLAKRLKEPFGSAVLRSADAEKVGIGYGYLSHILRVKLEWENDDDLPKTVIVKVPATDNMDKLLEDMPDVKEDHDKKKDEGLRKFHETECGLYHLFEKSPPCQVPKCYVAFGGSQGEPGVVILEDLR